MKQYADILLAECKSMDGEAGVNFNCYNNEQKNEKQKIKCMQMKLKVYYAILYLVAEYRRNDHSQESQRLLTTWIGDDNKLGAGFSTSGIPSRFFYTIGACASVHTSYDFEDVMKLSKQDGGYAHDYMHPRFAAVLLQLGDALDLDNDRFHPLMKEFISGIPDTSELHWGRHKSIRRLRISPARITIHADCEKAMELRLVQREYEGIKDILKNASFNWSAICPEELEIVLPELEPLVLLLNGQPISADLVNTKFDIQQKKAFNLLQGSNIYKNERFVFLREIFQNAIDASKLQYWKDWNGSRWKSAGFEDCEKFLSPHAYPIEIEFHLAVKEKYSKDFYLNDSLDSLNQWKGSINDKVFGVVVRVIDYGTGISQKDIQAIADVGTSYDQHTEEWRSMPHWLQPTAEFGVGLQSVFLVADSFTAETHVRSGESYKIEFNATGDKGSGYIYVTPLLTERGTNSFGSCFEVFVPCSEKKQHLDDIESWSGADPFIKAYSEDKFNQARKLTAQLLFYLDDIIGEKLFPVKVRIYDYVQKEYLYDSLLKRRRLQLKPDIIIDQRFILIEGSLRDIYKTRKTQMQQADSILRDVTWTYPQSGYALQYDAKVDCYYCFDYYCGKLFIADGNHDFYACVSAERILKMRSSLKNPELQQKYTKTKIYYKGVYVTEIDFEEDMDLIEYIDIKGKLQKEHLAVNRADFTTEGKYYIQNEIYPQILSYVYRVVEVCAKDGTLSEITANIENIIVKGLNEKRIKSTEDGIHEDDSNVDDSSSDSGENIHRRILFWIGLATFVRTRNHVTYLFPGINEQKMEWYAKCDELLAAVTQYIKRERKCAHRNKNHWSTSTFYNLRVYSVKDNTNVEEDVQNLAQILGGKNEYVIVSKRRSANSSWVEFIIKLSSELAKSIKQNVMQLKTESNANNKRKLVDEIEAWAQSLMPIVSTIDAATDVDRITLNQRMNQHEIVMWMLGNLPSLAVFSESNNNIRINVIDAEHTDSVYLSQNLKLSIYERMVELYKNEGIQRFSTVASTAFCQLGLEHIHSSVYFLKRGRFGKIGRRHMIVPLTGYNCSRPGELPPLIRRALF